MENRLTDVASEWGRYVGRIGALAVALGVGTAVVAMPLAAADSGYDDSAAVSSGRPDTSDRLRHTRTTQQGGPARAVRSAAGAPRAAATESGSAREAAAGASPAPLTAESAVRTGFERGTAQRRPTTAEAPAPARQPTPAAVIDPAAAALDGSSVTALTTGPTAGAVWSCRECRNPAATTAARPLSAPIRQTLTSPAFAVEQLLDAVGTWLSGLPSGPVSDLLAGALLLVRRGLFNQMPIVAPRVQVNEVLRPMIPEDSGAGSTFSTSLIGEVVGTLGAVDPEGAALSYTVSRGPQFGSVRVDPDGSWAYTPTDASAALADMFTVSVRDGGWNILDPFAPPTTVTVEVRPGVSSSVMKPGLISSDWLEVVKETGELNGDEPVVLTVLMTTTLGVDGSTTVKIVNRYPSEIASGVDAGGKVPIPDSDGDVWINYGDKFQPLTWSAWQNSTEYGDEPRPLSVFRVAIENGGSGFDPLSPPTVRFEGGLAKDGVAATGVVILEPGLEAGDYKVKGIEITNPGKGYISAPKVLIDGGDSAGVKARALIGAPVPVPLIVVTTLTLEGDFSLPGVTGDLGTPVAERLKIVGEELENTKIYAGDIANNKFDALVSAANIISEKVALTTLDNIALAVRRISDWFASISDPDDPVAVGVVGLIPLDGTFLASFTDPRTINFGSTEQPVYLDEQFMRSTTMNLDPIKIGPIQLWDFDLATRFGFLVPPASNDKKGGKQQGWETTYAGDYADNDRAEWKVETLAWPQVNW